MSTAKSVNTSCWGRGESFMVCMCDFLEHLAGHCVILDAGLRILPDKG